MTNILSGFGAYHSAGPDSKHPKPYTTTTLENIIAMAANPNRTAKEQAQWIIPSTKVDDLARGHGYQSKHGTFLALWSDLDKVNGIPWENLIEKIKQIIPGTKALIYTSRSATINNPKSRIIFPLADGIPGRDYAMMAKILNDRLESAGLIPDRATERPGQLCYLPNRGEFYQHEFIGGEHLNPSVYFAGEIKTEHERLKKESEDREHRHQEAMRKTQERIDTGQLNPVEAYRQAYPVETALERYGYTRHGNKYLSPNSESGNPGVTVKDGKWYSHHSGDAGIGQPGKDGGAWGDAFDLFVHYEYGGNFNRAVIGAGELFTTTTATGETITINKKNQRDYMKKAEEAPGNLEKFYPVKTAWEPITPLDAIDVDTLDPNSLPGIIGKYSEALSLETETPIELAAGMIFVVIAACVQGRIKIQIKPGYSEPLAYWTITPMEPATRKSQVLKRITAPLTDWERRKRSELDPLIKARRIDIENIQARIKALRAKYGKAKPDEIAGIADEIYELETSLEPEMVAPQIWAQDCTPENAGQIMARNDERLTILAAEGGILDTLGGRYSNGLANLDLFLQGYSGDAVRVNRTTRDDIFLDNPTISMGLMPQPSVIQGLAGKPEFRGRGFMGRPMYLMPKSNLGNRTLNSTPTPEHIKREYSKTIEQLLEIRPVEKPDGTTRPNVLTLSSEAFQEWRAFYLSIEKELADGGRFEHCRDWAGKTPGRAARLAGLIHCSINPVEPWLYPVTIETMAQALDITAVSCTHALAIFNLMGAEPAIEGAGKILKWIIRNRHKTFTKRQLFEAMKGTYPRVELLNEPLMVLSERNYIRPMSVEKKPGRPSEGFEVNHAVDRGKYGLA